MSTGRLNQLRRTVQFGSAQIEMVRNEVQECFIADKITRPENCVSVSARLVLLKEDQPRRVNSCG